MFLGILTIILGLIAFETILATVISGHDEAIGVCGDAFERKSN